MTDLPSGTLPIVVDTNRSAVNEQGVTRIYLSTRGTRISLARQGIHLGEGMILHMYSDDADVNGQRDDLVFEGVVHWSTWNGGQWAADVALGQFRSLSEALRDPEHWARTVDWAEVLNTEKAWFAEVEPG